MILENLEPKKVFYYFEKISEIPRCSGHEKEIADYIENFAKEKGYDSYRDEYNNVVVRKPASEGKESSPVTILQGHIDMVCVKDREHEHDFSTDALQLYVDGDYLKAKGTTLGADNGIAVAYMLAILDDLSLVHPELECVFTTDEEVGMTGALNLDKTVLKGKYFINVDSEEEGIVTVGCAGGNRSTIKLEYDRENASSSSETYKIYLSGLKGGHSGVEIDKNRANANVVLGRILNELEGDFNLVSIDGGTKDNVICFEAGTVINVESSELESIKSSLERIEKELRNEFCPDDKNFKLSFDLIEKAGKQLDKKATKKAIQILVLAPNGVVSMSSKLEGMVESSLNIGILQTNENSIKYNYAIRANVASKKVDLVNKIKMLAELVEAEFEVGSDYPEWEFKQDSKLLSICKDEYKKFSGEEAYVQAIHAGLETGVFLLKMPEVEAISIGPDMYDVHSPSERLNIASAERMYRFVIELLKAL